MMRQSNQNIGYDVGRLITIEQISPQLLDQFAQCNDLVQVIHRLMDVMPTLNNYVVVWTEKIDDKWYLCHRGPYHPSLPGYDQAEWFRTFALVSLCRSYIDNAWDPASIYMSFSSHLAKGYAQPLNSTALYFGHAFGAIEIPLPNDFSAIHWVGNQNWLTDINALISTYAVLPWFNIEWLSHLIGSSSRSLQRKLAEQGQTFRCLRDEARCRVATRLLSENLSPSETAWRCGYNDLSNFNRAFKGWVGQTPAQYQRQASK
ncbi:helix-turn-helix domain-containing protein [Vibrio hippocampi]|nr:helix-turn-helix domain-containing protein [Vibrio hippocampi]